MLVLAVCMVAGSGLARGKEKGAAAKPEAVTLAAAEVKYGPPPPILPAGAELAVLHGDPGKTGAFTMRFKMPNGYRIAPHWHSNDEELTVMSGTFLLAMGDKTGENVHAMEVGAYHYLPGKMHHSAAAKGETLIEIHGNGPFDLHYLDPADDPSKPGAAAR
jgi:quercetin dioxygenase-like cupin family protein